MRKDSDTKCHGGAVYSAILMAGMMSPGIDQVWMATGLFLLSWRFNPHGCHSSEDRHRLQIGREKRPALGSRWDSGYFVYLAAGLTGWFGTFFFLGQRVFSDHGVGLSSVLFRSVRNFLTGSMSKSERVKGSSRRDERAGTSLAVSSTGVKISRVDSCTPFIRMR